MDRFRDPETEDPSSGAPARPASMRVLLVTKGLDLGGIERMVMDLAVGLRRRGHTTEVAVINNRRNRLVHSLEDAGVPVHLLGGNDRIGIAAIRRLRLLIPAFDIVHTHGPLVAVATRLANADRKTVVVSTSHTPWKSLHPASRVAWRATERLDDATVAVSAVVAAALPGRDSAITIPHGVDPSRIDEARESTRVSDGGPMRAIVVASHSDVKNYPNLLKAVRHAIDQGADLVLTAIGAGEGLAAHRHLAASLGLSEIVTFEPPTERILERIAAADLLVVASDYEGQPIVVAEALALGKPVVATAVGRVPEMVTPTTGRVVPPRDPVALGSALAELSDRELCTALGKSAREHAFGWTLDNALDAHEALYEGVCGSVNP